MFILTVVQWVCLVLYYSKKSLYWNHFYFYFSLDEVLRKSRDVLCILQLCGYTESNEHAARENEG